MNLHELAAAYNIDDKAFADFERTVSWAEIVLLGPDPIPEPIRAEDPMPELVRMARDLHGGLTVFRHRHRLNLERMRQKNVDIADADSDVTDMLSKLGDLVELVSRVPLAKKGRRDLRMYEAIYNLGLFWKSVGGTVSQNFANYGKIPKFARFVCDVIECAVLGARSFTAGSVDFPETNEAAQSARSRIRSQIKYVVAAINGGESKPARKRPQNSCGRSQSLRSPAKP